MTAGAFYITQTVELCSLRNVLSHGTLTTYYVFNKIISDTLVEQYQIYPNENIQNLMTSLLLDIPVYNWKQLNWYNSTETENILEDTNVIYEAHLDDVFQLILDETKEKNYKDPADFEMAKQNFEMFFEKAEKNVGNIFSNMCMDRHDKPYHIIKTIVLCKTNYSQIYLWTQN